MDLDLQLVRAFVTVAEELSFRRAAERLYIAQPALSRQVRRLEETLGAELLERTTRSVRLTEAGAAFFGPATRLLASSHRAFDAVHQLGSPSLEVGFAPGLSVAPAVAAFNGTHPNTDVRMKCLDWFEQRDAVLDGVVDLCVGRLPIDDADLELRHLYDEPRWAVLHAGHRLADRHSISISEIGDDPIARHDNAEAWDAFWRVDPRPDGRRAPDGPLVQSVEEKLELVAAGRCIAILPESAARRYLSDSVRTVLIDDIPPAAIAIVTRRESHPSIVLAFIDAMCHGAPATWPLTPASG